MPCRAWGSSPFGIRLAAYDSRLLELCRSSDIHGTLEATKPRYASGQGGRSGCARERRDCEIQGEPKSFAALDLGAGAVTPELAYVTASYRLNGCERRLSRAQVIGSARSHVQESARSHEHREYTAQAIESARSHFLNSLRSTLRTSSISCGDTNVRTLSLVSQKGGAGKTTLSLHLAVAAHMAGFSVAIADLDPQVSAWKWSERRKGEPAAIVAQAEQLESIQARAAAGGLDLLIVDSAPHADRPALLACKAADLVRIPCRASSVDVYALGAPFDITSLAWKQAAVVFIA